jgi:3-hydroxyisobutyrate dehydrogenase-like beta-hydroxyacid dehydrogenase
MAGTIQQDGYPLVVYDTRPEAMRPFLEREARPARSPAEVAQLGEVILTSLPGPKAVEAVAIGAQGCWRAFRRVAFRLSEGAAGGQVRAPAVDPEKAATFISTHLETDRDR